MYLGKKNPAPLIIKPLHWYSCLSCESSVRIIPCLSSLAVFWRGGSKLDLLHWHVPINGSLDEFISILVDTVNLLVHWLRISFGARLRIPLRWLYWFRLIGLHIPLRRLFGFRVIPVLLVPSHPLPVTFHLYFRYFMSFLLLLNILVSLFYGAILGGILWHKLPGFYFPLVVFCLWPNKISFLLLWMFFCFPVPLMMLFAAELSVSTGVGGCGCPIYARAVLVDVAFWKFSNDLPNSASVSYFMIFLIMLHSICTGMFSGGVVCICVLGFGSRNKYPPALICAYSFDM